MTQMAADKMKDSVQLGLLKCSTLSSWSEAKDLKCEQFSGIRSFASLQDDNGRLFFSSSAAICVICG
jgi:hypothetical protein